jgi:outer membrane lipoprotein-sorting protein
VLCAVALAGAQAASGQTQGQALTADEIVTRVMQHDAARRAALAEYHSERTYRMEYKGPIGERQAQMRVKMDFSAPDRKRFTVISESGSTIFCHQILRKLMEGEQEGALEVNRLRSMLSPENYHLKLVGEERLDGRDAWVLEVSPKDANRFNYKGRVWVSKGDYAVMRIVGSPAKNPTWLMGSSKFDYRYQQSGDFWLPVSNDTVSRLRIGGEIKLTVDYGEYRITAAGPPGGVTAEANRGGGAAVEGIAVAMKR